MALLHRRGLLGLVGSMAWWFRYRTNLLFKTMVNLMLAVLIINYCIYSVLKDNPLARNYDIKTNTDESWAVPNCNVFHGSQSIVLGSTTPCQGAFNGSSGDVTPTRLFITVHSTPLQFQSRANLRELFKQLEIVAGNRGLRLVTRHVFVLGRSNNTLYKRVDDEHKKHGDMLVGDFIDSYRNLSLKMMFGMKYTQHHCPQADYLLKIDDDMFFLPSRLLDLLAASPKDHLYIGMSNSNRIPRRNPNNKFYISPQRYPGALFPPFVFGGATILSMDSVRYTGESHKRVPCLPLEDTYLGLLLDGYAVVRWTSMWARTESMARPLTDCELAATTFVESRRHQQFYVKNKARLTRPSNCGALSAFQKLWTIL